MYILREQFSDLLIIVNILSKPFSPEIFKYVCGRVFLHVNCLTLLKAAVIATVLYALFTAGVSLLLYGPEPEGGRSCKSDPEISHDSCGRCVGGGRVTVFRTQSP
jgi:hypothetical protein